METPNPTTPEMAQQIWGKVQYWRQRADELGASHTSNSRTSFVLSGNTGAIRCILVDNSARIFWLSLTDYPKLIDIYPTAVFDVDDRSIPPLSRVAGQALKDMLERDAVEVAPPVRALYGFVTDSRIVAVTFTKEVGEPSPTDRAKLGLEEDTYVADDEAFGRLCPATSDSAAWYSQFWELQERGTVVRLSERANHLPEEVWWRRVGMQTWMEFDATDSQLPTFIVGERYRSWLVASNTPALRTHKGRLNLRQARRGWFL